MGFFGKKIKRTRNMYENFKERNWKEECRLYFPCKFFLETIKGCDQVRGTAWLAVVGDHTDLIFYAKRQRISPWGPTWIFNQPRVGPASTFFCNLPLQIWTRPSCNPRTLLVLFCPSPCSKWYFVILHVATYVMYVNIFYFYSRKNLIYNKKRY